MSLFIGNISHSTKQEDLEDLFRKYGPNKISLKQNYAFVDFKDIKDAERALRKCNKKMVAGSEIELRWSERMKSHRHRNHDRHSTSRKYTSRSRSDKSSSSTSS